jgi:hypothetical protein
MSNQSNSINSSSHDKGNGAVAEFPKKRKDTEAVNPYGYNRMMAEIASTVSTNKNGKEKEEIKVLATIVHNKIFFVTAKTFLDR